MTDRRRVMITGAAGRIGQAVRAGLADRWDLVPTDVKPAEGVEILDVTDGAACRKAFAGADAVVHLAADPSPEATWESVLPANIEAPYQVATAAACGVRRLVLASSLHAVGGYPEAGSDGRPTSRAPSTCTARARPGPRPSPSQPPPPPR